MWKWARHKKDRTSEEDVQASSTDKTDVARPSVASPVQELQQQPPRPADAEYQTATFSTG